MSKSDDIKIFAEIMEPEATSQAYLIAGHPCIAGPVRIMPDAHAGAGCVIGFTGRFSSGVIPNIVGVDIGCGVSVSRYDIPLGTFLDVLSKRYGTKDAKTIFENVDADIRKVVPTGAKCRSQMPIFELFRKSDMDAVSRSIEWLAEASLVVEEISPDRYIEPGIQLGTLGGGNHFIEIYRFDDDSKGFSLVVHSGSRNLGHKIGTYFQNKAKELNDILKRSGKKSTREHDELRNLFGFVSVDVPKGLEYLPFVGKDSEAYRKYPHFTAEKYVDCAEIAQKYAKLNRMCILKSVSDVLWEDFFFSPQFGNYFFESVHNYIGHDGITRKGAIRAQEGERVVIPLSMRDGVIIGTGKGNKDWNYSAPHGAGRLSGRADMKRKLESGELSMDDFRADMEGVFTSSVTESTIDESSFAYKPAEAILRAIEPTVEVVDVMKPLFNLKDTEPEWNRRRDNAPER